MVWIFGMVFQALTPTPRPTLGSLPGEGEKGGMGSVKYCWIVKHSKLSGGKSAFNNKYILDKALSSITEQKNPLGFR